jgi:hypothetical protein
MPDQYMLYDKLAAYGLGGKRFHYAACARRRPTAVG